jgi:hypothetical protein
MMTRHSQIPLAFYAYPRRNLSMNPLRLGLACALCLLLSAVPAQAQYEGWKHSGSIFILTTPEGADLPATASVEAFPLLVRLHSDTFDFTQAQADGGDLRFTSAEGTPLSYQIEQWDPERGEAAIWVRIPKITGNSRQELRMFWGRPDATSESAGDKVFAASNGYASVWHLGDSLTDEVGTLTTKDVGTTVVGGTVGRARHLAGGQGVFGGEKIPDYPAGGSPHSTSAWFRAERPNSTIIGWGNEGGGRGSKVRMQFRSPPHVHIDSDFSDVDAPGRLPLGEWVHVVHTYANEEGRIYINGRLDGMARPKLDIKTPARLWLGGWYHHYDFVGDLDEVRISRVARSADWVRLEYENQKPLQTLVGPVVQPRQGFSVTPAELSLAEGQTATIAATAGGAQKLYWVLKRGGDEQVVAVDRLTYTLNAGRVTESTEETLQLRAVYPDGVRTKDIRVTIREAVPEPVFTLPTLPAWNGRDSIEIVPAIANLEAMQAAGAGELQYAWKLSGPAVIKETAPGKLILKRGLGTGTLAITLSLSNGGAATTLTTTLAVSEPAHDPWVHRTPDPDEHPVDGQFYARDDSGFGTLIWNGNLADAAPSVSLRVFEGDKLIADEQQKVGADRKYSFQVRLKPGLVKYRAELGAGQTVQQSARDLVCGDAYLIIGQSNAVATDFGPDSAAPPANEWVRTFGATDGSPQGSRWKHWATAQARSPGGKSEIGYWGMELGARLVESQRVPICIINGAVGGTRIDQHQRNAADLADATTIYGRLLWRVREARLTHGIRGIIWHQGENDQGADGPTGRFGWETYREYFHDLAAAWNQDYPNLQYIHMFQIWPKACAMGIDGSDNRLREVQRTLPRDFSHLSIMSTLGIRPPGGCHYPAAGYSEFARLLQPLIERDHYGRSFEQRITPPNLVSARCSAAHEKLLLDFDQPVVWNEQLAGQFYLDGKPVRIKGADVHGNTLTLRLEVPANVKDVTYLDSKSWSPENLLRGANGIAALTFCEVPLSQGQ